GGAKKRVGRRDEHPATPHGSERCNALPTMHALQWCLALCNRCNGNGNGNGKGNGRCAEPADGTIPGRCKGASLPARLPIGGQATRPSPRNAISALEPDIPDRVESRVSQSACYKT